MITLVMVLGIMDSLRNGFVKQQEENNSKTPQLPTFQLNSSSICILKKQSKNPCEWWQQQNSFSIVNIKISPQTIQRNPTQVLKEMVYYFQEKFWNTVSAIYTLATNKEKKINEASDLPVKLRRRVKSHSSSMMAGRG